MVTSRFVSMTAGILNGFHGSIIVVDVPTGITVDNMSVVILRVSIGIRVVIFLSINFAGILSMR